MIKSSNRKGSLKRAVGGGMAVVKFSANGLMRATERATPRVAVDGCDRYITGCMTVRLRADDYIINLGGTAGSFTSCPNFWDKILFFCKDDASVFLLVRRW